MDNGTLLDSLQVTPRQINHLFTSAAQLQPKERSLNVSSEQTGHFINHIQMYKKNGKNKSKVDSGELGNVCFSLDSRCIKQQKLTIQSERLLYFQVISDEVIYVNTTQLGTTLQ